MKIFTLSVAVLLFASPCIAQNTSSRSYASLSAGKMKTAKQARITPKSDSGQAVLMLPRYEEEYLYEGEWFSEGGYTYEYDQRGNVLKEMYGDESIYTTTVSTYDDNNMRLSKVVTNTEDGETTNSSKQEIVYDRIVTSTIVESYSYMWMNEDWMQVSDGHSYKRVITRNDKDLITEVDITIYFNGEYMLQHRSTITYNEDGLAETYKYEELGMSSDGSFVMAEKFVVKDMQWYTTDGQILALDDLSVFFVGNNRLKKGTVTKDGEITGYLEASYEENGNYTYKYIYTTEPIATETYTYTVTDVNGSYTLDCVAFEDMDEDGNLTEEELAYESSQVVTVDKYGRVTEESATEFGEMLFAAKYDYTYSDEYGSYPTEQVFSEYDIEAEEYVPFLKIVAKDFYNVADDSGVQNIVNDNEAVSEAVIYNLQGVRLDVSEDVLPAGIYVVNRGGNVSKIVRR